MHVAEFLIKFNSRDPRESIRRLINDIFQTEGWNQKTLASEMGMTQPAISRWLSGASIPRSRHLDKLLEIHSVAMVHRWASNYFVPICAFAESYPPELSYLASQALIEVLNSAPLSPQQPFSAQQKVCPRNFFADLHMRSAKLPEIATAYTFVDNPKHPAVFVVLVQENLSFADQRRIAWEEVYAHVTQYGPGDDDDDGNNGAPSLALSRQPLPFSPSLINKQHVPLDRNPDDKGAEDEK